MTGHDIVNIVVGLFTGGGLLKAADSLWTARAMAKKTDAESAATLEKTPAEVDSIVVQGAEQAVLTMQAALQAATDRIMSLEADRERDRSRIADLETRVDEAEHKARDAQRAADEAAHTITSLKSEIAQYAAESGQRP